MVPSLGSTEPQGSGRGQDSHLCPLGLHWPQVICSAHRHFGARQSAVSWPVCGFVLSSSAPKAAWGRATGAPRLRWWRGPDASCRVAHLIPQLGGNRRVRARFVLCTRNYEGKVKDCSKSCFWTKTKNLPRHPQKQEMSGAVIVLILILIPVIAFFILHNKKLRQKLLQRRNSLQKEPTKEPERIRPERPSRAPVIKADKGALIRPLWRSLMPLLPGSCATGTGWAFCEPGAGVGPG